jgi:hypothetical protein
MEGDVNRVHLKAIALSFALVAVFAAVERALIHLG